MSSSTKPAESGAAHERIYRALRVKIMHGEIDPGAHLTLRGIAGQFGVSMMPVRDSARRLVAEGALILSASGRLSTPLLARDRLEELASIRALLEPELAARAMPRAYPALIDRLRSIDANVDQMVAKRDASGYIRTNLEFHRTLYLRAQAPAMLAMAETVWLQLGPTMRQLYTRMHHGTRPGHHRAIIAALKAADEAGLRRAVQNDVTQGLRMLSA